MRWWDTGRDWGRGEGFTTRKIFASRWVAIRAILIFHQLWGGQSQQTLSINHNFWGEKRANWSGKSNQRCLMSVYQPTALPLGQTGSHYDERGHSDCIKKMWGYAHACTHAHTHSPSLSLTHTQTHIYTPLSLSLSLSLYFSGCNRLCKVGAEDSLSFSPWFAVPQHLEFSDPFMDWPANQSMLATFRLWNSQDPGQVQREKQCTEMAPPHWSVKTLTEKVPRNQNQKCGHISCFQSTNLKKKIVI